MKIRSVAVARRRGLDRFGVSPFAHLTLGLSLDLSKAFSTMVLLTDRFGGSQRERFFESRECEGFQGVTKIQTTTRVNLPCLKPDSTIRLTKPADPNL